MSVVNKMLQDLEARQSQAVDITADYQPPQKKQSKLLVSLLLTLAIAAIIFALFDKSLLFSDSKNTEIKPTKNSQLLPIATKKMTVAPNKRQQAQAQISSAPSKEVEVIAHETAPNRESKNTESVNNALIEQAKTPNEHKIIASKAAWLANSDSPNEPAETENSTEPAIQTTKEQTSSFSMSSPSLQNNASSLKQRIAESLNNENPDMAQPLLQQLLITEPDNIKARKKLASLLFAQGNYAQTKQLLFQGIRLHPAQGDLKLMLARLYVAQKEPAQGMKILAEFQPNSDSQIEYLAYRGALAQKLKHTELSKADYQTLTNIEPDNAKWWLGLAIAEDQLGETKMAVHAYNKASSSGQLNASVNEFINQRISILAGAQ